MKLGLDLLYNMGRSNPTQNTVSIIQPCFAVFYPKKYCFTQKSPMHMIHWAFLFMIFDN